MQEVGERDEHADQRSRTRHGKGRGLWGEYGSSWRQANNQCGGSVGGGYAARHPKVKGGVNNKLKLKENNTRKQRYGEGFPDQGRPGREKRGFGEKPHLNSSSLKPRAAKPGGGKFTEAMLVGEPSSFQKRVRVSSPISEEV